MRGIAGGVNDRTDAAGGAPEGGNPPAMQPQPFPAEGGHCNEEEPPPTPAKFPTLAFETAQYKGMPPRLSGGGGVAAPECHRPIIIEGAAICPGTDNDAGAGSEDGAASDAEAPAHRGEKASVRRGETEALGVDGKGAEAPKSEAKRATSPIPTLLASARLAGEAAL